MSTEIRTVKTKRTVTMPLELERELIRMRRIPDEFTVLRKALCRFCGEQSALLLGHALSENVGLFCTGRHGWIFFQSNVVRPAGERQPKPRMRRAA